MKLYYLIIFLIFSNSSIACDCDIGTPYEKYVRAAAIFYAEIGENHAKNNYSTKYEIKILEVIKGEARDTLISNSGGLCGTAFKKGDQVLLYLSDYGEKNIVGTNICSGNRVIKNVLFPKNNSDEKERIGLLEIDALKFYRKHVGEIQRIRLPQFKYERDYQFNILNQYSFVNAIGASKNAKLAHFEVLLTENGKILIVNFFTEIPESLKNSILRNLYAGTWDRQYLNDTSPSSRRILYSILYPKESRSNKYYKFRRKRDF